MKMIKYNLITIYNNGTKENPEWDEFISLKTIPYSLANLEIAKKEAYNGEYSIVEKEEPSPTQLDRIEAQITYTAMMTDTLLEV